MNLIAGIDKPSAGTIRIESVDIATLGEGALADWRAAHIGFIFQFYNLMPVLIALDNVELPLLLTGLPRRERQRRVAAVLGLVGLADRADHYPNELSGGQQQRMAIARAHKKYFWLVALFYLGMPMGLFISFVLNNDHFFAPFWIVVICMI